MGFVWLESRAETQTRKEQTKDDGGQRTVKRQGSGVRGLVSGRDRCRWSDGGGQRSEVRRRRSEVRGQRSEGGRERR